MRVNDPQRRLSRNNQSAIVFAQYTILALLVVSALLYPALDLPPEDLIYPVSTFLLALFFWSLWSWQKLTKTLFDPYLLFLLAAGLFNAGHAFLEVFYLNESGIMNGRFSPETVLRTLFLVILGLASFHLGALISTAKGKRRALRETAAYRAPQPARQDLRVVGWGLLFVSFIPAVLVLRDAVTTVMSSGYSGLFQREAATGFGAAPRVLATFLVPAALFLLAGSKGRRSGILVSGIIIASYSIIQFFLGSRAYAAMPLIAYAWLWHRCIRPLPKIVLLSSGAVLLFVVLPLVKVIRGIAGEERLSFSFLADAFYSIGNPATAIISEMGASMKTIAYTIELVPSVRDFDMGVGYLYAFLTVFPNLFWDIHPTIARGLAKHWLVWEVSPLAASQGRGLGFSFIAEAYLNFGWIGTPITLGIIGFLFAKLVLWADRSGQPARLAMVACFLTFFLFFSRSEAGANIRPLFWYSLLPYLAAHGVRQLRSSFPGRKGHFGTSVVN